MKIQKFNWKSFTSFGLSYAFIILTITGVILYLTPTGRVAHWTNWKLFFLTKSEWQAIHTIFSIIFIILSILHLFVYNWKIFMTYLQKKNGNMINKKYELFYATILTMLIYIGTIYAIPPFKNIIDFGDYLTEQWETNKNSPPVPHAELLSLKELARQTDDISLSQIENILKKNNIKYTSTDEKLLDISKINQTTPIKIYNLIVNKKSVNNTLMQGKGLGKMTLVDFAEDYNKDINEILTILKDNNIDANNTKTIKEIATDNDKTPYEILELIKLSN